MMSSPVSWLSVFCGVHTTGAAVLFKDFTTFKIWLEELSFAHAFPWLCSSASCSPHGSTLQEGEATGTLLHLIDKRHTPTCVLAFLLWQMASQRDAEPWPCVTSPVIKSCFSSQRKCFQQSLQEKTGLWQNDYFFTYAYGAKEHSPRPKELSLHPVNCFLLESFLGLQWRITAACGWIWV